ncbi:hypothetical protein CEXT_451551 [Caerostris extrusa]|uniref:Uncharacterized protein n=1 Tax=Caerostris extrusa TaxID=172846 RepID=A0AAV4XRY5_CAEEX|nr:hypothetical protein CEXT_451551 [Caerostris extrusa]
MYKIKSNDPEDLPEFHEEICHNMLEYDDEQSLEQDEKCPKQNVTGIAMALRVNANNPRQTACPHSQFLVHYNILLNSRIPSDAENLKDKTSNFVLIYFSRQSIKERPFFSSSSSLASYRL